MDILKNDLLRALCNNLKEGVAIAGAKTGQIVFCNDTWLELFGLESISGMDMEGLNNLRKTKITKREIRARMSKADDKGIFTEEVEYSSKGGHSFWGELSIRPFWNKGEHYYLVGIDPIDQMKEREQKMAQEQQRFDALLEYASLGVIETNSHAEIINVNPFALKLFGYERNELINKKIELLIPSRFHSKHITHRQEYIQHPRNRPMGVGMDLFAIKKNGTEFPVEVSLSSYNKNGDKCVIAFVSDISIRKEAEQEARQLNDKLEETVSLRTTELKKAVQQLEVSKEELSKSLEKEKELSELKSRFVSMASHEFRTPLSTVLSSAYLLEKYTSGEDQPKREKHLKRIISSVNMLTDILNDFLSVGKIEEGKIHVRPEEFNIRELIISIISEIKNNQKKGQKVRYDHEGDSGVFLDPSLLKHIVMNLVSNASKFSPEASLIEIKTINEGNQIVLSVRDHGIGISKEDQKHLMERFFRGTNATNVQGTGLGLHIVSKYAELMNGVVECRSELGKGTDFTISFTTKKNHYDKDFAY